MRNAPFGEFGAHVSILLLGFGIAAVYITLYGCRCMGGFVITYACSLGYQGVACYQ